MKSYQAKKIVALLPMKANSTRIPSKNFRDFLGKPLYRWILDTLLSVEEIDQVVINTDAREILLEHGLVENNRVLIRDRKQEICGDDISMNLVLADDIRNVQADIYLMTHTTNPLLTPKTIRTAITKLENSFVTDSADSLFSVNKLQSRFYRSDRTPINHDPENLIPTQELEPWFEENSNLYLFTASSFLETNARIGNKPIMHITPRMESIDIDTFEEWELALAVARYISS
ncbi:acylneuraminate cytidylyltransferase family protein [Synechococcus sp. A10-1-5-1]|uniref:acylneuraminate cytidylyltransferase family protein n=1 Tax=Synechococcus sp. A10-1-5-1 TaxID=2936507 RepID=UPI00200195CF|nr:acylneuraminate cytidylyltransferase family protein [Synechococcus sp. A10-1-5-1]UPM49180.1 acylneuraminate cytidylyltransferase family protein [Synechococcus sp. A10-1-5-1]